jgi:GNAT superfamily N-acetyltransferase
MHNKIFDNIELVDNSLFKIDGYNKSFDVFNAQIASDLLINKYILIKYSGNLVAYAWLSDTYAERNMRKGIKALKLELLKIDPDYQHKGLGSKLLTFVDREFGQDSDIFCIPGVTPVVRLSDGEVVRQGTYYDLLKFYRNNGFVKLNSEEKENFAIAENNYILNSNLMNFRNELELAAIKVVDIAKYYSFDKKKELLRASKVIGSIVDEDCFLDGSKTAKSILIKTKIIC